jgi:hypothetical protein
MIHNLIPSLLFLLILIGYVFYEPVVPSGVSSIKLNEYNSIENDNISSYIAIPTLEQDIVNNMKPFHSNTPTQISSYQPILSSKYGGSNL